MLLELLRLVLRDLDLGLARAQLVAALLRVLQRVAQGAERALAVLALADDEDLARARAGCRRRKRARARHLAARRRADACVGSRIGPVGGPLQVGDGKRRKRERGDTDCAHEQCRSLEKAPVSQLHASSYLFWNSRTCWNVGRFVERERVGQDARDERGPERGLDPGGRVGAAVLVLEVVRGLVDRIPEGLAALRERAAAAVAMQEGLLDGLAQEPAEVLVHVRRARVVERAHVVQVVDEVPEHGLHHRLGDRPPRRVHDRRPAASKKLSSLASRRGASSATHASSRSTTAWSRGVGAAPVSSDAAHDRPDRRAHVLRRGPVHDADDLPEPRLLAPPVEQLDPVHRPVWLVVAVHEPGRRLVVPVEQQAVRPGDVVRVLVAAEVAGPFVVAGPDRR